MKFHLRPETRTIKACKCHEATVLSAIQDVVSYLGSWDPGDVGSTENDLSLYTSESSLELSKIRKHFPSWENVITWDFKTSFSHHPQRGKVEIHLDFTCLLYWNPYHFYFKLHWQQIWVMQGNHCNLPMLQSLRSHYYRNSRVLMSKSKETPPSAWILI